MSTTRRLIEKRRRSIVGWITLAVFWTWNALMAYAMYSGVNVATRMTDGLTPAERVGTDAGLGIGFMMILIIWAMGAVVFGLMAHFTRGRREYVEVGPQR